MANIEQSRSEQPSKEAEPRLPLIVMPSLIVLVRHGESQANIVNKAIKNGIITEYPPGFINIPDREFHLSRNGRKQAIDTGIWFAQQFVQPFDVIFVSDHVRARETAALVCQHAGWGEPEILLDPLLGERNWGRFSEAEALVRDQILKERKRDPLHAAMPDGETLLDTRSRSRILLERAAREFAGKRILVFSHGEYIEAIWAEIEHMSTERQREFFHSDAGNIRNCQVVEFSSIQPGTDNTDGKLRWVRSSCPQAGITGDWTRLAPIKFTPSMLLEEARRYPRLDLGELEK